ncbi:MAG: hypothetical protein ACI94Y_000659 [Maribacter sp.]|jgi:hypothetical protein
MDKEYIRSIIDYMVEDRFKESDTVTLKKMPRPEFEAALKKLFIGYFSPEYIEAHFAIPDDFWNFLEVLKGSLNANDWEYIHAKSGVIAGSEDNLGYMGGDLKERFE